MKKLLLISTVGVIACLTCAVGPVKAQEQQDVGARLLGLVGRAENEIANPFNLHDALVELNDQLRSFSNTKVHIEPEIRKDITHRLIAIYNKIVDDGVYGVVKVLIIEAIEDDHGQEAKEFFLNTLERGTENQRAQALRSIHFGQFRSDEIYDEIKILVGRGTLREDKVFSALKGANPERALKEIQDFLAKTKDPSQYVRKGSLLCDYKKPELLDVLVDRYEEFDGMLQKNEAGQPDFVPAKAAFNADLLRKYIRARDGRRLIIALKVLKSKGISGDEDLPLWREKLKSKDLGTRRAVLEFLDFQIKDKGVSFNKTREIVGVALSEEKDKALKPKAQAILKNISPRLDGGR